MAKLNVPIPQDKIEECFVWRDWFQRLSNKVFGNMADQNSNAVSITGGNIQVDSLAVTGGKDGQLLIGRTSDHKFTPAYLTAGTGVSIVTGPSTIIISQDNNLDLSSPPPIGNVIPNTGTFTTLIGGGGSANYGQLTGGATTKAVQFRTLGTDTNISMALQSKGTGAIDFAAGSSGVNISNGGTVTAVTRTNGGSTYTSVPTVAITAPTTAGGVQAVATATVTLSTGGATIASGGTGYTVSDVLTVSGGTGTAVQLTVATVSSGVITSVTITNFGSYSTAPTNPVSVTGGTGSSATFNLSYGVNTVFTITNAGSGYVEQPTVTFSGGGGSGAAAYTTVGGNTVQKTIGNIHTLSTPNSSILALVDKNSNGNNPTNTTVAFSMVGTQSSFGASYLGFGAAAYFGTTSTAATAFLFATSVSSPVSNGAGGSTQFQVAHTASAVNYVQVTGGSTGSSPLVSAQGSDANLALGLTSKGTGAIRFSSGNASFLQFRIGGGNSAVNNLAVNGSIAGATPILSSEGADTNIDLALTPKGTGNVRFGTYTGTILTPTGYINITDSGGTVRRLLVG